MQISGLDRSRRSTEEDAANHSGVFCLAALPVPENNLRNLCNLRI